MTGPLGRVLTELADAGADLILGSVCVGCGRPGRPLCPICCAALPPEAAVRWPTPSPAGLATPYSVGPYDDTLRALILGHKERRLWSLRRPLGDLLALAVGGLLDVAGSDAVPILVPVPSRARAVRARGYEPTLAMTRVAVRRLREAGCQARCDALVKLRPGVVDQAGLSAEQRHSNLVGSMACRPRLQSRLAQLGVAVQAVVCDDVLTTGATARETQRALEAVGVPVLGIATVAATVRRGPHREQSGAAPFTP